MDFYHRLPKIELHAHLNGSLSNETLAELRALKYGKDNAPEGDDCFYKVIKEKNLTLKECFQKFKYAHDLTDQKETLAFATRKVIQDFAADNVVYLELRTTPKATTHMTKREYLTTVLETIKKSQTELPTITVKLIPSIDRSKGLKEAEENVALVLELLQTFPDIIKGMDLSGAPYGTTFSEFRGFLEMAQAGGLKMALHCGEFDDDNEVQEMFEFGTDRIGHGTFIKGANLKYAKEKGIPFECCLTSNVKCNTVKSYEDHHFKMLWSEGYHVCISTDDFGVFDTSLSQELRICSEVYKLTKQDILQLQERSINYIFAEKEQKQKLTEVFNNFKNTFVDE